MAQSVQDVKRKNKKLALAGILLTKYHERYGITNASVKDFQTLADMFGTKIFETKIPENVAVREAQFKHQSLFEYVKEKKDKSNSAALAYARFIVELTGATKKEDKRDAKKEDEVGGIRIITRRGVPKKQGRKAAHTRTQSRKTTSRK